MHLQDAVVTIDAIATMTHVVATIIDQKGDYILEKSRLRERNAALCLAMLRKLALTLLKKSDSKESIKTQRLALAWDEDQLSNLINLLNFNDLQRS